MDGELQPTPERQRRLTIRTSAVALSALMLAIGLYGCTARPAAQSAPNAAKEKKPTVVSYAGALQALKNEDALYQELNAKRGFLITIHGVKMREYEEAIRSSDDDSARNLNFEKQEEEERAFRAQMEPIMTALTEQAKRLVAAEEDMEEAAARDAPLLKEPETTPIALDGLEPTPNVSAADVIAGYRANVALFRQSRVKWNFVNHREAAWYENQRLRIENAAKAAKANGAGAKDQRRAAKRLRENRSASEASEDEKYVWYCWDYWTDGERIHLRSPSVNPMTEAAGRAWRFSDEPLTPKSLHTTYKDYCILSFQPRADAQLRCWRFGGASTNKVPAIEKFSLDYRYPPLLAGKQSPDNRAVHALDPSSRIPMTKSVCSVAYGSATPRFTYLNTAAMSSRGRVPSKKGSSIVWSRGRLSIQTTDFFRCGWRPITRPS
jgi:hypothetical protein